jgi:hypothetical protein
VRCVCVSFPGIKRPKRGADHSYLAPSLKKEKSYTSTPPLGLYALFEVEILKHNRALVSAQSPTHIYSTVKFYDISL